MDAGAVRSLLKILSELEIEILKEPETGLVMINVTDCFHTDFHLGEVLVTTAGVRIEGHRGWGMIMGDDADRALLLAALDVMLRKKPNDFTMEIRAVLEKWLAEADARLADERRRAAATRVNFQSMAVE